MTTDRDSMHKYGITKYPVDRTLSTKTWPRPLDLDKRAPRLPFQFVSTRQDKTALCQQTRLNFALTHLICAFIFIFIVKCYLKKWDYQIIWIRLSEKNIFRHSFMLKKSYLIASHSLIYIFDLVSSLCCIACWIFFPPDSLCIKMT